MKGKDGIDGKGAIDALFPDPMSKVLGLGAVYAMGAFFAAWLGYILITHVL